MIDELTESNPPDEAENWSIVNPGRRTQKLDMNKLQPVIEELEEEGLVEEAEQVKAVVYEN